VKVGAVILARLDSKRLPEKAMRELNGRPLIQYAFDVCAAVEGIDRTILATTELPEDDRLVRYAESRGIDCFRGAVDNVAGRFLGAMERYGLDAALRYNGDSPLNRPALLAQAVAWFREKNWDLVTNVPGRTYPFGISVEVIGRPIMKAACAAMTDESQREHVTKFFYDVPSFARTRYMTTAEAGMSGIQLAVDDGEDMERVGWILEHLRDPLLDAPLAALVELARAYERQRRGT
jgi:spore coat polysaccharide biosynthesis protein SpsF